MSDTPTVGSVKEQAAHWAVRLEDERVTELERQHFEAWVLADPAHEEAFLNQVAIGALAGEMTLRSDTSGLHLVPQNTDTVSARRRVPFAAIAATALLVLISAATWFFGPWSASNRSYVTGTREQLTVALADGSSATLNTRSELHWIGSPHDRRVVLKRGEVLFDVKPDATRPFRVLVDDAEIRVVGTTFNAYRKEDGTLTVTVIEGKVAVTDHDNGGNAKWSRQLSRNQQMQYPAAGTPLVRNTVASKAVRWRRGELEIEDDPLSDVIAELSRYTDQRIILLDDPRLSRLHVGGVLSVLDIDSALALLESREPIKVIRNPSKGEYTLAYREPSTLGSRLKAVPRR